MDIVYKNQYSYCGAISMVKRLANEDLVVVFREALWRGYPSHFDQTARASLVRSTDNGASWHSLVNPDNMGGNGTTINQLSDGMLILTDFHWMSVPLSRKDELKGYPSYMERYGRAIALEGEFVTRSIDDGYTWEAPRKIDMSEFDHGGSVGRVIELKDGSLLLPIDGRRTDDKSDRSWVMRSTDRGLNWKYLANVGYDDGNVSFQELRILQLSSGRILGTMRTPDRNFYQCFSDDEGKTWSTPKETPIWCTGSSPLDIYELEDGRVLASYGRRKPPFGIRVCLSEDEGKTWDMENEVVLRDDGFGRDVGYPSSEQLDDGSILTVYYWYGNDNIRHVESTRWVLDA
jgi:sialidase-1